MIRRSQILARAHEGLQFARFRPNEAFLFCFFVASKNKLDTNPTVINIVVVFITCPLRWDLAAADSASSQVSVGDSFRSELLKAIGLLHL